MKIGNVIQQAAGYKAFVPLSFPPQETIQMDNELIRLLSSANFSLGKLDGITQTLPALDFFIFMYVRKEAALSSEIEGTQATMIDSIEAELAFTKDLPADVDDILHYINAMRFGLKRLEALPISLRLVKEVHNVLLTKARTEHFAYPGEFRITQNWIGGTSPENARYVPPPVGEMLRALDDLEKFMHKEEDIPQLIKAGLLHAQFETIHPFLDGNGRTGRLLTTFYLCQQKIIERPVLYLSEYFKRHRKVYFDLLQDYHDRGEIKQWLTFFLTGIAEVAENATVTAKKINQLRNSDIEKIESSSRSSHAVKVLNKLYELPIVNSRKIQEWTGLSRDSANDLIHRFIDLKILSQRGKNITYGRTYEYKNYIDAFIS